MANNLYNNKVELADGTVLIDLTEDTVTPQTMLAGVTAHAANGEQITGVFDAENIESAIAIVANKNTHAEIKNGQYVYVKNHTSLSEGLYMALSDLSENAVLSSNVLQKITNGGLNTIIKTKTQTGTTQAAGQFNTGLSNNATILAVKANGYIGFARLDNTVWWGFLKNWDLSNPGAVSYSATIYYLPF